ncbi:MAG: hypothetical protein R3C03_08585 [Pirellulaceae bacterium]
MKSNLLRDSLEHDLFVYSDLAALVKRLNSTSSILLGEQLESEMPSVPANGQLDWASGIGILLNFDGQRRSTQYRVVYPVINPPSEQLESIHKNLKGLQIPGYISVPNNVVQVAMIQPASESSDAILNASVAPQYNFAMEGWRSEHRLTKSKADLVSIVSRMVSAEDVFLNRVFHVLISVSGRENEGLVNDNLVNGIFLSFPEGTSDSAEVFLDKLNSEITKSGVDLRRIINRRSRTSRDRTPGEIQAGVFAREASDVPDDGSLQTHVEVPDDVTALRVINKMSVEGKSVLLVGLDKPVFAIAETQGGLLLAPFLNDTESKELALSFVEGLKGTPKRIDLNRDFLRKSSLREDVRLLLIDQVTELTSFDSSCIPELHQFFNHHQSNGSIYLASAEGSPSSPYLGRLFVEQDGFSLIFKLVQIPISLFSRGNEIAVGEMWECKPSGNIHIQVFQLSEDSVTYIGEMISAEN